LGVCFGVALSLFTGHNVFSFFLFSSTHSELSS
jgi:hypothetical protein